MKLSQIKKNPDNPRVIKDERFKKLVQSIEQFPKMMKLRPIIIDSNNVILGGNMRYEALKQLDFIEIPDDWVKRADELTEEEKQRFIIADNVGFGDWDFEALANDWDVDKLEDWGLELPGWEEEINIDYSGKNKEIDVDDFEDKMVIKLEYTAEEYEEVKTALHKIAATPEQAVWQLLGLNDE